jgi:hypothetical protein
MADFDIPIQNAPLPVITRSPSERLSLATPERITLAMLINACTAFASGCHQGARTSGLRFLAENSHRMPKSQKGWYIYHRYKKNKMMIGGLQAGVKRTLQWSIWPGVFLGTEAMLDDLRGGTSKDFFSTTVAGVVTGGIYSLLSKSPSKRMD